MVTEMIITCKVTEEVSFLYCHWNDVAIQLARFNQQSWSGHHSVLQRWGDSKFRHLLYRKERNPLGDVLTLGMMCGNWSNSSVQLL